MKNAPKQAFLTGKDRLFSHLSACGRKDRQVRQEEKMAKNHEKAAFWDPKIMKNGFFAGFRGAIDVWPWQELFYKQYFCIWN